MKKLAASLVVLLLSSCAVLQKEEESPQFETSGNLETLVILGTNDIHGALAPEAAKTKDATPIDYERGGAVYFATQLHRLRDQYGDHLIFLDAGDEFQGSIDSNLEEGRPMVKFFNELGLTAAAVGNHEFDFGPEGSYGSYNPATGPADLRGTLKARIAEAHYPYLAANIYDKKTDEFPGVPGTKRSILVRAGGLKVGIIGLTTIETPTTTRPEYAAGLAFKPMAPIAIEEAKKLREEGAQIVLLVAHAGLVCNIPIAADRAGKTGMVKSEGDFQTGCESNHEIPELLRSIPKGTIDAVVSGHTHTLVHHWIEGVPVIQAGTRDNYFNLIYLTYDWNQKKLLTSRSRIEGPVPICPKVFANQKNCDGDVAPPPNGRGDLVAPKFRGSTVDADSAMESVLKPTFEGTAAKKAEVVAKADRPIPHLKTEESPMGDLIADAIRQSVHADIAIMNTGGIRADWTSGDIHYEDVFRTLPFDNFVAKLTLTGKELKRFIRISQAGSRGFFPTSGLRIRVIRREDEPYANDLDGDHKISPWELDRVLEADLINGSPIEDSKLYTVATLDFLVSGGDSMGWFMKQLPKERVVPIAGPVLRDVVVAYMKDLSEKQGGLNSAEHPLVNPSQPRLILSPRPSKKNGKKRQSRGGHRRKKH